MIAYPSIPSPSPEPTGPVMPPPPPPVGEGWGEGSFSSSISSPYDPAFPPQASAPKPQASPSPFPTHPSSFSLHPSDAALLEALIASPSIESYAKSNALPLTNLALWLQQPHIAAAHEALLHLRALDLRTWQEQVTKEAIDTLRETMKASEDLVERRRCANTILRALTRSNRPTRPANPPPQRGGGSAAADRAQRQPGGGASSGSPQASSPKPQAFPSYDYNKWAAEAEARQTALRTDPTCPEVLQALDNKKPAPFPKGYATTPESCADQAVARLSHIPDPTGHRLYLAIYDALDIDLRDTPGHWDPFKRTLEASHFVKCREGWTRTDHPLERQPKANTATRKYTFTNTTTGETKSCTLALSPRRAKVDNPNHWWITHLITPNTS